MCVVGQERRYTREVRKEGWGERRERAGGWMIRAERKV